MNNKYIKRFITILTIFLVFLPQTILAEASGDAWATFSDITSEYDGSGVRIALIDTGVSCKYIDESRVVEGKNYVFPDKTGNDLIGHGTAIAGIILGSDKLGIKGIASGAELVPLVYYSRYITGVPGNGGIDAICKAIYDAIDIYGCRIINISSGITADNDKLREAIAYAEEKNVLVVSSVGNTNRSSPDEVYYPVAYETVIGVGSINEKKEVAGFSQRNISVKLVAPGVDIPTVPISNSSKPVKVSGSSYSAAFITGAAALLLEANPELSAAQLREILYRTAEDLGSEGYDTETGWGLIDVSKALSEAPKYMPLTSKSAGELVTVPYLKEAA
ncbi:S8 family peptidase [Clostridium thermosuccinogenes]|uniref:S8 family peptidase n=1 Tax=Clostridium thermosuccinogenes TaxID=84032 RepID=UPI001A9A5FA0|nr:S8 family serine peptidase [Pseudoclostridium thermosuccinogenes]